MTRLIWGCRSASSVEKWPVTFTKLTLAKGAEVYIWECLPPHGWGHAERWALALDPGHHIEVLFVSN